MNKLVKYLGDPYPLRTKPLFWKMGAIWPINKTRPDHWVSYAIVHENWKLVANYDLSYMELYSITVDAYEKNDLNEEYIEVTNNLIDQIKEWQKSLPVKPSVKLFSKERQNI